MTRSHQKSSSNQRRSQQPYVVTSPHNERGQSMPKDGIMKISKPTQDKIFEEPNSSSFKTGDKLEIVQ
jgi:hypothetical protein